MTDVMQIKKQTPTYTHKSHTWIVTLTYVFTNISESKWQQYIGTINVENTREMILCLKIGNRLKVNDK